MGNRMINYSVFMLPNPVDKTAAPKAYAKAQANEVMTFRNFTQHIADHGGYSRGKVKGIVSDMCACLVEMLLQGKKVQLDELGDFWLSLTCEGAESCEAFSADNIKGINIIFSPGVDFENLINKAEFTPVASRAAQAATLKAEKLGVKTVDLEAAKKKKPSSSENGGNNPSGGNTPTGGNPSGGNTPAGGENSGTEGTEGTGDGE
jgi:predicted histone-like DNA-binding protein